MTVAATRIVAPTVITLSRAPVRTRTRPSAAFFRVRSHLGGADGETSSTPPVTTTTAATTGRLWPPRR